LLLSSIPTEVEIDEKADRLKKVLALQKLYLVLVSVIVKRILKRYLELILNL